MKKAAKKITDITPEDLQKHGLRLDLSSIKEAGYNRRFAREYLFDRYVNLDSFLTESDFNKILDEFFKSN